MPWQTYDIPSDSNYRLPAEEKLLRCLADTGYDDHAVFSIRLAFDEAVANAIKHGNKMDFAKKVHIRFDVNGTRAVIEVEDEGQGFCDESLPDPCSHENLERPHGRGVMLIKSFMDEVEYEKCGRLVRMIKYRDSKCERSASRTS